MSGSRVRGPSVRGAVVLDAHDAGQIRTTLIAMPRRALQLTAKHLAVAIVVLPAAAITAASGVALTAGAFGDAAVPATSNRVAGTLSGVTAYLVLTASIGAAAGTLLRRTPAAVVVVSGYFLIVGPLLRDRTPAAKYLPDSAGFAMWVPAAGDATAVTPAQGALLFTAWTVVLIGVSALGYRRWDM